LTITHGTQADEMTAPPVLILDNGAYKIKAGYAGVDWEPRVFDNSIARSRAERKVFVADEVERCRDMSGIAYRRPFEKVCRPKKAMRLG
jgi:actin-related protein 6